jgi:hypothetical protein
MNPDDLWPQSRADSTLEPYCFNCLKPASEILDIVQWAEIEEMTPAEYAREDGTYNPSTNRFACTDCYIAIGMPSSPRGWVAP